MLHKRADKEKNIYKIDMEEMRILSKEYSEEKMRILKKDSRKTQEQHNASRKKIHISKR